MVSKVYGFLDDCQLWKTKLAGECRKEQFLHGEVRVDVWKSDAAETSSRALLSRPGIYQHPSPAIAAYFERLILGHATCERALERSMGPLLSPLTTCL